MVDSYAWGAQGGILQGAADLTGALLGYPLALDHARRQRLQQDQQTAELERQHQRQDVADAFMVEDRGFAADDRARRMAAEDQAAAEHRNSQIFAGNIDVAPAHASPGQAPLDFNPNGTPVYDGADRTGMVADSFEQGLARRGQQERDLKDQEVLARIAHQEEMAAGGAGGAKAGKPGAPKADTRQVWEYHVDPASKKVIAFNKVTGERKEFGSMDAAKAAEGAPAGAPGAAPTAAAFPTPTPRSALHDAAYAAIPGIGPGMAAAAFLDPSYDGVPTADAFNASQAQSEANPFIPPAMRGTPDEATFGRTPGSIDLAFAQLSPEAQASVRRIYASGDQAKIEEVQRRLLSMGR